MPILKNKFASASAFGKTFILEALNEKGDHALIEVVKEEVKPEEAALVKRNILGPGKVSYYITDESFKKRITEVSEAAGKEFQKKAKLFGIKKYDVDLQTQKLIEQMTTYNVLEAILKQLKKHGATLYDVQISIR